MQFKPNFKWYHEYDEAPIIKTGLNPPYVAVYNQGNKTLVYMCDKHRANRSYDMIDWVFDKSSFPRADVFLVEKENDYSGRVGTCNDNSLFYAAARAAQNNIPVVFADLSEKQMLDVLIARFPDEEVSPESLSEVLSTPPRRGHKLAGEMSIDLNRHGRDKFMLENIAAALNKYDTVYVIFGEGHFHCQQNVIESMLGEPQYIECFPNMRRDFGSLKINPITFVFPICGAILEV